MTISDSWTEHPPARRRVIRASIVGIIVLVPVLAVAPWQVAVLAAWDATAAVLLILVLSRAWSMTSEQTRAFAKREDNTRRESELLLLSAAVASLIGVGLGLVKAGDTHGATRATITGVAVLSVLLSWAVVTAVYTLRYAHEYYAVGTPGGIDFNEKVDGPPDYRDFAYLAATVGMTYQVSDTPVTSRAVRRTVTGHALLSYVFGTGVVAMMINVVAGLLR
jgi:uncharacterized membrane protein